MNRSKYASDSLSVPWESESSQQRQFVCFIGVGSEKHSAEHLFQSTWKKKYGYVTPYMCLVFFSRLSLHQNSSRDHQREKVHFDTASRVFPIHGRHRQNSFKRLAKESINDSYRSTSKLIMKMWHSGIMFLLTVPVMDRWFYTLSWWLENVRTLMAAVDADACSFLFSRMILRLPNSFSKRLRYITVECAAPMTF